MNHEQKRSDRPGAGKRAEEPLRRQRTTHPKGEPTAAADKRKQETNRAQQLRQVAQETLARSKGLSGPTQQLPVEELVAELEMHQIELEMQNEELRRAQLALEESRSGYADLYDFAPIGYLTISRTGRITAANLTGAALLGVGRQKLIHRGFGRFVAPEEIDRWDRHRLDALQQEGTVGCELTLKREGGSLFQARLDSIRTVADDGAFALRTMLADISERKRAEEELHRAKDCLEVANRELEQALVREQLLARTDNLTGLYNHRRFFELAVREFSAAVRYQHPLAILMFDLDDFKQVNDTIGHTAGDKMLVRVAQTAAAQIRGPDVLARYGGDEFVILLPQTSAQQALPIAGRIGESIAAIRMETYKGPFGVTLSIGIAEMRRESVGENVERIVQRADKALYEAKAQGRNCTVIYSAQTQWSEDPPLPDNLGPGAAGGIAPGPTGGTLPGVRGDLESQPAAPGTDDR